MLPLYGATLSAAAPPAARLRRPRVSSEFAYAAALDTNRASCLPPKLGSSAVRDGLSSHVSALAIYVPDLCGAVFANSGRLKTRALALITGGWWCECDVPAAAASATRGDAAFEPRHRRMPAARGGSVAWESLARGGMSTAPRAQTVHQPRRCSDRRSGDAGISIAAAPATADRPCRRSLAPRRSPSLARDSLPAVACPMSFSS